MGAERLLLATGPCRPFDTSNDFRGGNAQCLTDAEQNFDRGRLLVVLKLTDVGAVDLCRKGKLFLRHFGIKASFAKFMTEHPRKVCRTDLCVR